MHKNSQSSDNSFFQITSNDDCKICGIIIRIIITFVLNHLSTLYKLFDYIFVLLLVQLDIYSTIKPGLFLIRHPNKISPDTPIFADNTFFQRWWTCPLRMTHFYQPQLRRARRALFSLDSSSHRRVNTCTRVSRGKMSRSWRFRRSISGTGKGAEGLRASLRRGEKVKFPISRRKRRDVLLLKPFLSLLVARGVREITSRGKLEGKGRPTRKGDCRRQHATFRPKMKLQIANPLTAFRLCSRTVSSSGWDNW